MTPSVVQMFLKQSACFLRSTLCCYQSGRPDVEQNVGVFVSVDVGQSSGVRFIFLQRADSAPVMVIKYSLKNR